MEKPKKDVRERVLSASRLKTLETCSWSYWCNYHLKLPQKQNEGALRGTVCHLVFEMLVKKKHKKHYTLITKAGGAKSQCCGSPLGDETLNTNGKEFRLTYDQRREHNPYERHDHSRIRL